MFNKEVWIEIFETIRANRLRTFLTAFSVAWGIFILIILLGSGQGLSNGASKQFESDAVNSIWINGGITTKAFNGFQPGRNIQLTNEDFAMIHNESKENKITASYDRGNKTLTYKNETGSYFTRSCMPDHDYLENCTVIEGRFVNDFDIAQYRKVAAIGVPVRDALFKKEDAIGKYFNVGEMIKKEYISKPVLPDPFFVHCAATANPCCYHYSSTQYQHTAHGTGTAH